MQTPENLTIKSGKAEALICPALGCQTLSWKVNGQDLIYLDPEYFQKWPGLNLWGNPILFPAPGLCSIGQEVNVWKYEEKIYPIEFHGFADKLPWKLEFHDDSSIVCTLAHSEHTLRQYPFEFLARQKISLTENSLTVDFEMTNHSIQKMPYGVGWHPYFKKQRAKDGSVIEWLVKMPSCKRWTGNPAEEFVDWNEAVIKSSDRFGIGNVLLYNSDLPVTLYTDKPEIGTIKIEVENFGTPTRQMAWVIWNIASDCDYLCVEPWTAPPNVLNIPSAQVIVEPGQTSHQKMTFHKTV